MKTIELHYTKTKKYEDEEQEYRTWVWNGDEFSKDFGWVKRPVPNFTSTEHKQAEEWLTISNREDLIFLEKELLECQYFIDAEKHVISVAQEILK